MTTQTLTFLLERLPKKAGGVRYKPNPNSIATTFAAAIYIEQGFLRELTDDGTFPPIIKLTVEAS